MSSQLAITFLILAAVTIQGKELDAGPQTFENTNSSSTQSPQKRFATKEVIVYLTPSQIKALESGKAELQSSGQTISYSPSIQKSPKQNVQVNYNPHLENLDILKAPIVQELLDNNESRQQKYFKQLPENNSERPTQIFLFHPEVQQAKQPKPSQNIKSQSNVQSGWTPVIPVTEKTVETTPSQEQYKYGQNNFGSSYGQVKQNEAQTVKQTSEPKLQFGFNYDSQFYALQKEHALRLQKSQEENQRAKAQAEAIANSLPILIHKEVQITKHKPVPVIKHVNVPVPTPVLVPVLHPYEVQVPQPYPVPVEIIKHVPVPIVRNEERPQAEKVPSVSYEQRQSNAPGKNIYINVDSPFLQVWKH